MIYRFNVISIKILLAFFAQMEKKIPQIEWTLKGAKIDKVTLKKKVGAIILPDFKAYDNAIAI